MARTDFDTSDLDIPLKAAPIVSLRALEHGDNFEDVELSSQGSIWRRALSMLRRRRIGKDAIQGRELLRFPGEEKDRSVYRRGRRWSRWLKGSRICVVLPVLMLVFL